jgi:hypothetical protein
MLDNVEILSISCAKDPLEWAKASYDWGVGPLEGETIRPWQADILKLIGDHLKSDKWDTPLQIAVSSGHGIGKSTLIAMISDWGMSTMPECRVICTANTETQLRTKTSPEVGRWFRRSLTADWWQVATMTINAKDPTVAKTWRMDFTPWSASNTEAFAGLHNKRKRIILAFDEASKIDDAVWETAEGAMTDTETEIIWLVFGNPTQPSGRFRECFRRFRHRWHHFQVDSRDVPGTNKELFKQWAQDHGEDSDFFKVRVRGMFPVTSARQFISGERVDSARGKHLRPEQFNFAPVILGVDPAWTGDDEFVIVKRQGLASWVLATYPKNDDDVHMANLIRNFEIEHKASAVFVDGGFGTGIVSAGKHMGGKWVLVWFASKSPDLGCLNMRAYMWDQVNVWLGEGAAIPDDQILADDLIGPELVPRIDGKKQLQSKEDMKQDGKPSPNRADALALTFAHPVRGDEKDRGTGASMRDTVMVEYDVFS